MAETLELHIDGRAQRVEVDPGTPLLYVLRNDAGCTAPRFGCGLGQCGACTVQLDGEAVYSCLVLAVDCQGREVTTIEGVTHPLQQAFIDADAFQCGYCTPGQIMSLKALFDHTAHPSDEEIERALSGNLCRCGAYPHIVKAARLARDRS